MSKTKLMVVVIFKSIWLGLCALWFLLGGLAFISTIQSGQWFLGWLCWGFGCAILTITFTLRTIISGARDGARAGANTFTSGNGYITNHPFIGGILGVLGSFFISLLFGPITLLVYSLASLPKYIKEVKYLRALNAQERDND